MNRQFYDPNNQYYRGFLKEYNYWNLEVSYLQHTLGNYIIFFKERKKEKISELTSNQLEEFRFICAEIEEALLKNELFKPDRFNYWQMGNKIHQLHFHGIPRYKNPRKIEGRIFQDNNYGSIPIWTKKEENHIFINLLNKKMSSFLKKQNICIEKTLK